MTVDQFVDRVNSNIPTEGLRVEGDFSSFAQTGLPFYLLRSGSTITTPITFEGKNGMKFLSQAQQLEISKPGPKKSWSAIKVFQSEGEYKSVQVQVYGKYQGKSTSKKVDGSSTDPFEYSLGPGPMTTKNVDGVKGFIESDNELLNGAEVLIPMEAFSISQFSDVNISEVTIGVAPYLLENEVPVELTSANVLGAWESGADNVWTDFFIKGIKPSSIESSEGSISFEDFKEMKLVDVESFKNDSMRFDAKIKEIVEVNDPRYIGGNVTDDYVLVEINNGPGTAYNRTALVQLPGSLENNAVVRDAGKEVEEEKRKNQKTMLAYILGGLGVVVILYFLFRKK